MKTQTFQGQGTDGDFSPANSDDALTISVYWIIWPSCKYHDGGALHSCRIFPKTQQLSIMKQKSNMCQLKKTYTWNLKSQFFMVVSITKWLFRVPGKSPNFNLTQDINFSHSSLVKSQIKQIPSRELTYPFLKAVSKMNFQTSQGGTC